MSRLLQKNFKANTVFNDHSLPGCKPNHNLKQWFPLQLHDGGSILRLIDGPDVELLIHWLVPDACLWFGPPWLNLRFSLVLTICES